MFQKPVFENILKSNSATGLEVVLLPDGKLELNVLVLEKNKTALTTVIKEDGVISFEAAAKLIDVKSPIILILNGKGIIHRNVEATATDTLPALLNKVLPNANIDEFVLQHTNVDETHVFVSVIRRSVLDDIMDALKKEQLINIANCLLGPFAINDVLHLIDDTIEKNNQLLFGGYQIQRKENVITGIDAIDASEYKDRVLIGGEYVSAKMLLPFAAAVSYYTDSVEGVINAENVDAAKEEHHQKQKFGFLAWSLLIAAFSVLLINYFVFNFYWIKNQETTTVFALNQSVWENYKALKTECEEKQEFLEQNGLLESSKTSFYMDELAASLPRSIQWLDASVSPKEKKKSSDNTDEVLFKKESISISGNCNRSVDLNDWIKKVRKIKWVKAVSLVDYVQNNSKENGLFSIEILIKK